MTGRFTIGTPSAKSRLCAQHFGGCDLTNSPAAVDLSRSPSAPNMIRDVPGKVRKMQGYKTLLNLGKPINGCFVVNAGGALLHAGTELYYITDFEKAVPAPLYSKMANVKSMAVFLQDKLYIFDTEHYLAFFDNAVHNVSDNAKIPKITIAGTPQGSGEAFEELNLLTPKFCETYLGTADAKVFNLSHAPLDASAVTARIRNADKSWRDVAEGSAFSVNRQTGQVTFVSPPGMPPVAGEPNVEITAARTIAEYAPCVLTAHAACTYGVNGVEDRIFVGGSAKYANRDYYSAQNNGGYFGDHSYCIIGDKERIEGYSALDGMLVTHKNGEQEHGNLILRNGNLSEGKAAFPIVASLAGAGLAASRSIGMLAGEPLYLSKQGIMAVTRTESDGSRYAQCRSFYLNGGLLQHELSNACAVQWQDFYVLANGEKLWLLDGLQPTARAEGMPWSARQYEGYYRENCAAEILWQQSGKLFFGTKDGKVCRFCEHTLLTRDYCDDTVPVKAHWDLPEFGGGLFYKNKTFAYIAVRLAAAPITGVHVSAQCKGIWQNLMSDKAKAGYLSFKSIVFSKFTFRCDDTPRTIGARIRLKKADKVRFRMENSEAEPFGINEIAL
ncbi:MAG: hypothetical protein RR576_09315, partial [Oscillospiraceae bacterium]